MTSPDKSLQAISARTPLDMLEASAGFDAIVIGAGASGSLAARLLCEAGLKVLILDAGWRAPFFTEPFQQATAMSIARLANPHALRFLPPRVIYKGRQVLKALGRRRQPVQSTCYAWERDPAAFVDDLDNPYETAEGRDYAWLRTRKAGGRVCVPGHGRQYYRFSEREFDPQDGLSPAWPFAPEELAPWYSQAEALLQLAGTQEGISDVPDSEIAHALTPTEAEIEVKAKIEARWPDAPVIAGRFAAPPNHIEAAAATGNLHARRGALVREVLAGTDGRACGVAWHDREAGKRMEAKAPIVFCCASPLESTRILMLSRPTLADNPIGARSGALGKYLMDHILVKTEGIGPGLPGKPYAPPDGRCSFLPRFDRAIDPGSWGDRGFGVQLYRTPGDGDRSWFTAVAFGEMVPDAANHVRLHPTKKDAWGIPSLVIDAGLGTRDMAMTKVMSQALYELADLCEANLTLPPDGPATPGTSAHECGTARMAARPEDGVLDAFNQCWDMPGLYVTDASSFPSQGFQNPTLTVMALTARACDHAAREKGGQLAPTAPEASAIEDA
ncbi:MAG: GMC family oxidoreductase [Hyphomonadaceae bacterium]|nr:GMC family oxidoreductase [Hyphomonadaceae bacterium]